MSISNDNDIACNKPKIHIARFKRACYVDLMSELVPLLKTKRLFLIPLSLDHVSDYSKYFVDYEVIRHLSAIVPWPYPKDGVIDYFNNVILPAQGMDRWAWGIFQQTTPTELIGCIDLWRKGRPENRGFWLGTAFWGRGFMSEATDTITEYAFDNLGFEKLVFSNAVDNKRSRRIKEKAGARFIGIRPAEFVDPELKFAETWELTKEEWQKTNSQRVN